MNQLKQNKIGFSNELHNKLHPQSGICDATQDQRSAKNNFLSENHFRTQEQTKSKQNEEYSFTDLHSEVYDISDNTKQVKDKVQHNLNDKEKLSIQNDNKLENSEHIEEQNLEQQKKFIKRQKYNAYMKSYRERKKKEIEERIKSIDISLNEQTKSYNKDDIKQALFD
ncbi:hypothetical protein M9Y10_046061 [Tritrichomonas musculus]|uniref:Uncharacterized protein n=1 Tax=Tritrichomonas musculus TaxID=1915356 RepID=A0ABR2JXC8_9EUKA